MHSDKSIWFPLFAIIGGLLIIVLGIFANADSHPLIRPNSKLSAIWVRFWYIAFGCFLIYVGIAEWPK